MGRPNNVTCSAALKYQLKLCYDFIGHPIPDSVKAILRKYEIKEVKLVARQRRFLWDVTPRVEPAKHAGGTARYDTGLRRRNFPVIGRFIL
jgi:hypothetical protein